MDHRVEEVITSMKSFSQKRLTLSRMGRQVNLSPWRLGHIFKIEVGTSPLRYLRSLRIQRAQELLERSHMNVKEIMASIGIADPSDFYRDFRRITGLSPQRYRAKLRSEKSGSARSASK